MRGCRRGRAKGCGGIPRVRALVTVRRVRKGGVGGGIGDIVLFEREDGVHWCTRVLEGDERRANALDTIATFFALFAVYDGLWGVI